jgi:hypothetical protein
MVLWGVRISLELLTYHPHYNILKPSIIQNRNRITTLAMCLMLYLPHISRDRKAHLTRLAG